MADGSWGPAALRTPLLRFPFLTMATGHCNGACSRRAISSFSSSPNTNAPPSLLVFSGGTAFNGVIEELKKLTTRVAHVLPVSDDGGSTAEIVRVLGGPAVGDIRSRCLRLSDESTSEALAVRRLLGHRLSLDASEAKTEWYEIVEGEHYLWNGVSQPYRETIRAFLVYFQNQILRRSNESFCFSNGSIGNFFFAGARIFFQSLDAAIFLFSRVSEIPTESLVLPVISTNDRLTLGCELWDGTIIRGQNEISHPSNGCTEPINKDCTSTTALPSRIKRVFYMSSEGSNLLHEVFPAANPRVLEQLGKVDCIVYAMGSLFTSICPSLVLHGIGEAIASRSIPKVLLLNGSHDRETTGLSASGFVSAITDALNQTYGDPGRSLKKLPSDYINSLLVPRDGQVTVDVHHLADQGIFHVVTVDSVHVPKVGTIFDPKCLIKALADLISAHKDSMLHPKAI
ncbi:putative gluconeogenesis factor [Cocos nucifera]|uniref:Putative gluconeogenesis factor n=1 Tax=Cocos nucifera TaxID=13894 RepID=A0A8K0IU37_COCNU|nr:putative gluconeogenesis factor [Cocos nucifera]